MIFSLKCAWSRGQSLNSSSGWNGVGPDIQPLLQIPANVNAGQSGALFGQKGRLGTTLMIHHVLGCSCLQYLPSHLAKTFLKTFLSRITFSLCESPCCCRKMPWPPSRCGHLWAGLGLRTCSSPAGLKYLQSMIPLVYGLSGHFPPRITKMFHALRKCDSPRVWARQSFLTQTITEIIHAVRHVLSGAFLVKCDSYHESPRSTAS